jgi:CheY-like chemotaxis protein
LMKANESYRWSGNERATHQYGWAEDAVPPRVLVAEDDDAMRALLVDAMQDRGFEVVEAKDGAEAIDRAILDVLDPNRSRPFDVLVLDVSMPGITGLEVIECLRSTDLSPAVVIISAFADGDVYKEAARLGCVTVFKKPFSLDRLMYAVEAAACCRA